MTPPRKVYIVRGSEDGNLGVYSNFRRAYKSAFEYEENAEYGEPKCWEDNSKATYQKCQIYMASHGFAELFTGKGNYWDSQISAKIELFYLNH